MVLINEHELSELISRALLYFPDYDKMNPEDLARQIGEIMQREKLIAEIGNKITQNQKNGRWWIFYNGRLYQRKSKKRVIDAIIKYTDRRNSLDGLAMDWLTSRMISRSGGTYRRDKYNYEKYIKGTELAKLNVNDIKLKDCYKWAENLLSKKPMKQKYWANVHGTLNSLMHFAGSDVLKDLEIHRDKFLEKTRTKDENQIFSDEEKKKVKKLAYDDASAQKSSLPLGIPLIFCTGIRDGELCALHWRDIEDDRLHVQSEMVEDTDLEGSFKGFKWVDHCKSEAGDRLIELSDEAKRIFHLVKQYNFANGIPVNDDSFIFMRKSNDKLIPCTTRSFECRIKKYCRQAGMTVLKSQHDARRTFATDLYYKGMDLKDLQKRLGHSSLDQTQAYIYSKPCTNAKEFLDAINL